MPHQQRLWQAHLDIFFDTATPCLPLAQLWVLTADNHSHLATPPAIYAAVSSAQMDNQSCLAVSYFIQKNADIALDISHQLTTPSDYLWQENCLECFVEYNQATAYFESNITPDGRYNVYCFDDYRTPDIMPPRHAHPNDLQLAMPPLAQTIIAHTGLDDFYACHVRLITPTHAKVSKINPCVILHHENAPIFYAVKHATPPDFHDKRYWLSIPQTPA